jgi:hypothetical protein
MNQFDLAANGKAPFKDFISILSGLQEAGLVRAVNNGLTQYWRWAESRTGEEALRLAEIIRRHASLKKVEAEHGVGAALDLDHPLVVRLNEWGDLDPARHQNALTYRGRMRDLHQ